MPEYTCECCNESFEEIRTEEDIEQEFKELFPMNPPRAKVCESCFIDIMQFNSDDRYKNYIQEK